MAILEEMCLGHLNNLPLLAQEVRLVILMQHEFFNKADFSKAIRAVLLLGSLMHEVPRDLTQKMDYFIRKAQREVSFLKLVMA